MLPVPPRPVVKVLLFNVGVPSSSGGRGCSTCLFALPTLRQRSPSPITCQGPHLTCAAAAIENCMPFLVDGVSRGHTCYVVQREGGNDWIVDLGGAVSLRWIQGGDNHMLILRVSWMGRHKSWNAAVCTVERGCRICLRSQNPPTHLTRNGFPFFSSSHMIGGLFAKISTNID